MVTWTVISIIIFQIIDSTTAWDRSYPLILIGGSLSLSPKFPSVVRKSNTNPQRTVYYPTTSTTLTTYAFCPNPSETGSNEFCNYAMKGSLKIENVEQVTNYRCRKPVEFKLSKKVDRLNNHQRCTESGYLYTIEYLGCVKFENRYEVTRWPLHVYEVCYDETEMQNIRGNYTIETPLLLSNSLLRDEQKHQFPYNTKPYHNDFLNQFARILEPRYNLQNNTYVQRSVLPHEWLPFAHQRRPLFHYVNVAPMDNRLKLGWDIFMDNLKIRLSKMNGPIHVSAGTFGEMKYTNGKKAFLGGAEDQWQIPIPYYWWILINNANRSQGVVVMMNNNLSTSYYHSTECGLNICTQTNIRGSLPFGAQHPYNNIYCCRPSVITNQLGLTPPSNLLILPRT